MSNALELRIDKFTFRVALDRFFTDEGIWVKVEDKHVRVGISDYLQQRSGDVAFVEVKPVETVLAFGEELAVIETIKVNISLSSPVTGTVIEVNPAMETMPEAINQDPYGVGWMALIETSDGEAHVEQLLNPQEYFAKIKLETEQERKKE
ncbi:MAG: hypothetical protein A2Z71_02215 [Chloroflexi bacterium RBG_13_50_21]|nr:MAG: hypothetical protein A2Z71_02215 [Chloroflexi bacterium RBG_13_50_21]